MPGPFWGSFFGALVPGILAVLFAWAAYLKAKAGAESARAGAAASAAAAADAADAKAHGEKNGVKLDSIMQHQKRG
jgi:hypothetical protein